MELAGLEPATSWVRFKSAAARNPHHERVSGQSSRVDPSDTPRLPRGFGDGTRAIPKTDWLLGAPIAGPDTN
jgi:hypothetical protein